MEQELLTLLEYLPSPQFVSGVRVARSLVFCVMFCRSLFVLLSFFPLVIVFFDLQILITFLISSNSSYICNTAKCTLNNNQSINQSIYANDMDRLVFTLLNITWNSNLLVDYVRKIVSCHMVTWSIVTVKRR